MKEGSEDRMKQLNKSYGPRKVWTRVIIFEEEQTKFEKMPRNLRKWALSSHRITAKLLYMAVVLPI